MYKEVQVFLYYDSIWPLVRLKGYSTSIPAVCTTFLLAKLEQTMRGADECDCSQNWECVLKKLLTQHLWGACGLDIVLESW